MTSYTDGKVIDLAIRIGFLGLFIYGALMLVAPLVGLMLWAVILAVAIYPLHDWLSRIFGGRRKLSAVLLTIVGLLITLGPVALLGIGIVEAGQAVRGLMTDGSFKMPSPPESIRAWPLVGPKLHQAWTAAHTDLAATMERFVPQLMKVASVVLVELADVGKGLITMLLAVLIMGVLLIAGPAQVVRARSFADRILETSGPELLDMAGATVRNVSRGVIGVAAIQALLAGIVMAAFGIDFAGPLALAALVLGVIQIGPGPILIPVILWGWATMPTLQALLLTVLLGPVMIIDNILKPIFMSRGLDTPTLVILIGVIGGLIAYGMVGIFVGPVILAVFHKLFTHWVDAGPSAAPAPAATLSDDS